jgi:hypothetical protein
MAIKTNKGHGNVWRVCFVYHLEMDRVAHVRRAGRGWQHDVWKGGPRSVREWRAWSV